ncbi:MAG: hypothetical protein M1597_03430 [Candidatus Thermoplasmatota archaeon]|nr:hypothetical protein [Candidatus Thermoplasmatota archaeon]
MDKVTGNIEGVKKRVEAEKQHKEPIESLKDELGKSKEMRSGHCPLLFPSNYWDVQLYPETIILETSS